MVVLGDLEGPAGQASVWGQVAVLAVVGCYVRNRQKNKFRKFLDFQNYKGGDIFSCCKDGGGEWGG